MQRITTWIESQTGWRAFMLCLCAGALATLSFAPFYIFPSVVLSLVVLFLSLSGAASRRVGFLRGWAWGFGFFVSGTYWISLALLVDAEQFAWLVPFALFGLTGLLALFVALMGMAFVWLRQPSRISNIMLFTVLFCLFEFGRGTLLTGFPWNLIGYSAGAALAFEQLAALVGVYGLSLIIVLWSVGWLCFTRKYHWAVWFTLPIALMLNQAMGVAEPYRISGVTARVVQANIEQKLKWNPAYQRDIVKRYVRLSQRPGLERVELIIWPETALPFVIYEDGFIPLDVYGFLQEGQLLITGGTRAERSSEEVRFWNSVFVINHEGAIIEHYDKHHLVPFGEYVPFSDYLPMDKIAPGFGAFSQGKQGALLSLDRLPAIAPLICYEAIFPSYASTSPRAQLLLNLTNDAWFGTSIGPHQHEAAARMRAIEQGVPMLRAANTGISGYYYPNGTVFYRTVLAETTSFDVTLSQGLSQETVFSRWGVTAYFVLLTALLIMAVLTRKSPQGNL